MIPAFFLQEFFLFSCLKLFDIDVLSKYVLTYPILLLFSKFEFITNFSVPQIDKKWWRYPSLQESHQKMGSGKKFTWKKIYMTHKTRSKCWKLAICWLVVELHLFKLKHQKKGRKWQNFQFLDCRLFW